MAFPKASSAVTVTSAVEKPSAVTWPSLTEKLEVAALAAPAKNATVVETEIAPSDAVTVLLKVLWTRASR